MNKKHLVLGAMLLILSTQCMALLPSLVGEPSTSVSQNNSNRETRQFQPSSWLSGWAFRKLHTVVGSAGAGLNYQLCIDVHYGSGTDSGDSVHCNYHCQPDFSDIRFTDADGVTLLDHWRQSVALSDHAVFWVEIAASLNSSLDIYVYYGNATCASASSGSATFPFFDDFERADSAAVGNGWTEDCYGGGYTDVHSNQLRISAQQHQYCHVEKPSPSLGDFVVEAKIKGDANGGCSWAPGITVYWNQYDWASVKSDTATARFYAEWNKDDSVNYARAGTYSADTWYWYRVKVDNTTVFMEYSVNGWIWNPIANTSRPLTWSGAPSLIIVGKGYEELPLHPGSDMDANGINGNVGTQYADDVFVRKHVSSEPTHGAWGAQEPPSSGESWLTGWAFRKLHNITGSSGAGANYQINIVVHYGIGNDSAENLFCGCHCQPDFDDIRFTSHDGASLLDYWRDDVVVCDSAVFWVEIADNLNSTASIFVYYGNAGAENASNGEAAFVFFDDFESGVLTSSKWQNPGDWQIVGTNVKHGSYAAYCVALAPQLTMESNLTGKTLNYSFMLHVWARFGGLSGSAGYPAIFRDTDSVNVYSIVVYNGYYCYDIGGGVTPWSANSTVSANTYYRTELGVDFQNNKQHAWMSSVYLGETDFRDRYGGTVTGISWYGPSSGYHPGEDVWIDDCFITKWIPNEPQNGPWGAETTIDSSPPELDSPPDMVIEAGTMGHAIVWYPEDMFPASYQVYKNGMEVGSGLWNCTGEEIRVSVDGLALGTYNYTLIAYDAGVRSAYDTVFVVVVNSGADTNLLGNPGFETGYFSPWVNVENTTGNSIQGGVVYSGDYSLRMDSISGGFPYKFVYQNISGGVFTSNLTLRAAIYPNSVGYTCGEFGRASISVMVRSSTGTNIEIVYIWSGYDPRIDPRVNTTLPMFFLHGWTSNTWNILERNILEDYAAIYGMPSNTSNLEVYQVSLINHISNGVPGTFYMDSTFLGQGEGYVYYSPPYVSDSSDMQYEAGTTGHSIVWTLYGTNPATYQLFKSGTPFKTGPWNHTNEQIHLSVDGLGLGRYNYTVVAYDTDMRMASDIVIVTVIDTTPPMINHPSDIRMTEGTIGQSIAWSPSDLHPLGYSVRLNGTVTSFGLWNVSGEQIVVTLDGLGSATYMYYIIVIDAGGNWATDLVTVTVDKAPQWWETFGSIESVTVIITVGAVAVIVIVSGLICRTRK